MSKTMILIHGAWHGGWCWGHVVPLLEAAGYTVYTPTLPGHGAPHSLPVEKITLHAYASAIGNMLLRLSEPAILVGHSMGGIVLHQAAERWPDRIEQLLYVSALMPPSGSTAMELMTLNTADPAHLEAAMHFDQQRGICSLESSQVEELFYHDCQREDIVYAQEHLCPQALVPLLTPVETTEARFGRLPRGYIQCLNDRVLSLDMQQAMCQEYACKVRQLPSGHSPFLSQPERLVEAIVELAATTHELVR